MVRKAISVLSPIAALAVVWVSLQSLVFAGGEPPPMVAVPATPVTSLANELLPELGSVSQILAETSTATPTETVPETIAKVLSARGAVLLVSEPTGPGGQL